MQLKASTDYGVRAVLYLATQGGTCSSKDIAKDMSIPRDYLIQLAQLLRNAGLIEARPGKHGGYSLAKDPADITMLDIMNALESEGRERSRERMEAREGSGIASNVKRSYDLIFKSFDAFFDSLTIASLLDCAQDPESCSQILGQRLSEEGERLVKA